MKNTSFNWALAAGAAMLLVTSCGKQESTSTKPASSEAPKAAEAQKSATEQKVADAIKSASPGTVTITNVEAPKPVETIPPAPVAPAPEPPKQATAAVQPAAEPTQPAPAPASSLASMFGNATASLQSNALSAADAQKLLTSLSTSNQVQPAVALATNQVQAMLERAKTLTSNQKYQEAVVVIQQLYATKLTPEQQKTVDGLKTQVQAALSKQATNASSILGGVLGGKK